MLLNGSAGIVTFMIMRMAGSPFFLGCGVRMVIDAHGEKQVFVIFLSVKTIAGNDGGS
jgi:hypothetical protein